MNLTQISNKYNTQQKCIAYLQHLRWGKFPICSKCSSFNIVPIGTFSGRYHCNECKTTFSVMAGTIFEDTRLDLPTWFSIIYLVVNSKKGKSAMEISRDMDIRYETAWYTCMRIRCGMIDKCISLQNITEMDESYIGGKPRKRYHTDSDNVARLANVDLKRGRGTKKIPVVGIVERKGKIVLKVIKTLTTQNLLSFFKEHVNTEDAVLMTDEFSSYKSFDQIITHLTVDHSKKEYVKGSAHTNTIEGFWSILKNSIKGCYVALSEKYLPFYLVQAQYIYNLRDYSGDMFENYMKNAMTHEKCLINYKPKKDPKKIVYQKCGK